MPQHPIRFGSILWADVHDPVTGEPCGEHPVVVLSQEDVIARGGAIWVAVCSTNMCDPPPSGWFEMPTLPQGHPTTGLDSPCVVKATWIEEIPRTAINRNYGKRAPTRIVRSIMNWLRDRRGDSQR